MQKAYVPKQKYPCQRRICRVSKSGYGITKTIIATPNQRLGTEFRTYLYLSIATLVPSHFGSRGLKNYPYYLPVNGTARRDTTTFCLIFDNKAPVPVHNLRLEKMRQLIICHVKVTRDGQGSHTKRCISRISNRIDYSHTSCQLWTFCFLYPNYFLAHWILVLNTLKDSPRHWNSVT